MIRGVFIPIAAPLSTPVAAQTIAQIVQGLKPLQLGSSLDRGLITSSLRTEYHDRTPYQTPCRNPFYKGLHWFPSCNAAWCSSSSSSIAVDGIVQKPNWR